MSLGLPRDARVPSSEAFAAKRSRGKSRPKAPLRDLLQPRIIPTVDHTVEIGTKPARVTPTKAVTYFLAKSEVRLGRKEDR